MTISDVTAGTGFPEPVSLPRSATSLPQVGFGLFLVEPEEATRVVEDALDVGYRHFDTASAYNNEASLGKALAASGLGRTEFQVTTKLWNDDHGHAKTLGAFDRSIDALGLEYVDLYLIHWPVPARNLFVETWATLTEIIESGRAKAIGVSNFLPEHIEQLASAGLTLPSVNQIELHPLFQQTDVVEYMRSHDIQVESWAPLGHGAYSLADLSPLVAIAQKHGKSVQQVVLRWHIQEGFVVIPKSTHKERMMANFDLFDFALSDDDITAIRGLDEGRRIGTDPREKN